MISEGPLLTLLRLHLLGDRFYISEDARQYLVGSVTRGFDKDLTQFETQIWHGHENILLFQAMN
jgi:hypothetical protein